MLAPNCEKSMIPPKVINTGSLYAGFSYGIRTISVQTHSACFQSQGELESYLCVFLQVSTHRHSLEKVHTVQWDTAEPLGAMLSTVSSGTSSGRNRKLCPLVSIWSLITVVTWLQSKEWDGTRRTAGCKGREKNSFIHRKHTSSPS